MAAWAEALKVARAHDGCITAAQLASADVTDKAVRTALAAGWLRREYQGVYVICGAPATLRQRLQAAVLATGGAASDSSAAELWGFRHLPYLSLEVSVARGRFARVPGVHVHHVTSLPDDDVTDRFGMRVTTFERTLVDCTTVLSEFQLGADLDDGLRRGVASLAKLRACVERLRSGPGRRLSVIRSLLEARPGAYNPGGSRAERSILDLLVGAGLPAPVQQYRVDVDGRTYFLDYAYPARKVFLEYYGLPWHTGATAVAYDSDRITAMSSRKWVPLIFTSKTPDRVIVERTAAALAA